MAGKYEIKLVFSADGSQVKVVGADTDRVFKNMKAGAEDAEKGTRSLSNSISGISSKIKLLGGTIAGAGITALAVGAMNTYRSFESLNASLITVTGSSKAAASEFAEIEKFASTTPYNLEQSVQGFVKLKALGLDPSMEALRSYGNTASAMGKDLSQMIEAVADASTGEFERLKEFGIKARSQGDQVSFTFQGVTTTIGKNAKEIEGYLKGIGDVQFGSAMADQMNTVNGKMSNLGDAFDKLQRTIITDSGAADAFKAILSGMANVITLVTAHVGALVTTAAALAKALAALLIARKVGALLGGLGASAKASSAGMLLASASTLKMKASLIAGVAWANKSKIAMQAMGATIGALGGPIGIAVTAIGLLVGKIISARAEAEKMRNRTDYSFAPKGLTELKALEDALVKVRAGMDSIAKTSGKTSDAYAKQAESAKMLEKRISDLKRAEYLKTDAGKAAAKAEADRRAQILGMTTDYSGLLKKYDQEHIKMAGLYNDKKKLSALLKAGIIDQKEYGRMLALITAQTGKLTGKTKEMAAADKKAAAEKAELKTKAEAQYRAYKDLLGALNPLQKATDDYDKKLAILDRQFPERGAKYDELRLKLDELTLGFNDVGDAGEESGDKMEKAAGPVAKAWEAAMERVDAAFASAWEGAFDSFASFATNIRDSFKKLLAELAHQAITKPIVMQFSSAVSGMFGLSGAASAATGSTGGAASGGILSAAGGYLSSGISGVGAGLGYAGSYGASMLGGAGSQQAAMLAAQTGEFGLSGATMTGSSLGYSGAAGVGLSGLAIGGGLGYLTGSLVGTGNSDIGGAIGGAIGTAIAPVIGTAIGSALGSVVGGLTGTKWQQEGHGIQFGVSGGDFVGNEYQDYKKKTIGRTKWRTEIEDMDAELNAVLTSGIDAYKGVAKSMGKAFGRTSWQMKSALDSIFTETQSLQLTGLEPEEIQARLQEWIDKTGAQILTAVVPQMTTVINAAGDRASELLAPLAALAIYIGEDWQPAVRLTLQQAAENSLKAVEEQFRVYDGSVGATKKLAAAVTQRYQIEVQLLQAIAQARASVASMVDDQKRAIEKMTSSTQDWYNKIQGETMQLVASLKTASSSEEIKATMAKITSNVGEAMTLMTEDQQKKMAGTMTKLLDDAEAISQQRLDEFDAKVKADHAAVVETAKNALESGKPQSIIAAQAQQAAAKDLSSAATDTKTAAASMNNSAKAIFDAAQAIANSALGIKAPSGFYSYGAAAPGAAA